MKNMQKQGTSQKNKKIIKIKKTLQMQSIARKTKENKSNTLKNLTKTRNQLKTNKC